MISFLIKTLSIRVTPVVIILMPLSFLFSAFDAYPTSTSNLAIGRMAMNINGNFIDIQNEPSSIVVFDLNGGEVIWGRPFQLKELQQTAISGGIILNNWGIGISASTFGNDIYDEEKLVFSLAKSFKRKLSYGINCAVYQIKLDKYGTASATGISASLRYKIDANWQWVTTAKNLNAPKIGEAKDELPQVVTTGVVGILHENFTIAAEWEQDIQYDGAIKFGLQAKPIKSLALLAGYISNPGQITAGLSIIFNKIYIEYGTIAHNDVGLFSHQLGVGINFNRR